MATTNINLATIDRVVTYSPHTNQFDGKLKIATGVTSPLDGKVEVKVPSFLGRIGAELTGTVTAVLSTAAYDILAKTELGVTLEMTDVEISFAKRYTETRLPPIGDSTPTHWILIGGDTFHYQAVDEGVLSVDTTNYLWGTIAGFIDKLVFPLPSRPVQVLERVISRCYVSLGVPVSQTQRLYVNGALVQSEQGPNWPKGGIVEYQFNTPVSGPITSIEIDVFNGIEGPFARLYTWEVDYIYR